MSSDVIIGHDGKPRCPWVGAGDTASIRYHDEVWGTRTHDESAMFEALTTTPPRPGAIEDRNPPARGRTRRRGQSQIQYR